MRNYVERLLSLTIVAAVTACTTNLEKVPDLSPSEKGDLYASCGVNTAEYERLMSLDYAGFDQDLFGGWRAVDYRTGCTRAAGHLILDYIDYDRSFSLSESQLQLLLWHAGQMKAYENDPSAVSLFERTYDSHYPAQISSWDLYVIGTIAFLKRDKETLISARDQLAVQPVTFEQRQARQDFLDKNPNVRMPEGYVTQPMNLPTLNSLVRCFDQPYKIAYQQCPKPSVED